MIFLTPFRMTTAYSQGKFKGAEGYICRIKKNSRLVVAIQGVCAVATSYIPQSFIQKI